MHASGFVHAVDSDLLVDSFDGIGDFLQSLIVLRFILAFDRNGETHLVHPTSNYFLGRV